VGRQDGILRPIVNFPESTGNLHEPKWARSKTRRKYQKTKDARRAWFSSHFCGPQAHHDRMASCGRLLIGLLCGAAEAPGGRLPIGRRIPSRPLRLIPLTSGGQTRLHTASFRWRRRSPINLMERTHEEKQRKHYTPEEKGGFCWRRSPFRGSAMNWACSPRSSTAGGRSSL
jgi:hypothetical protein